MTEMTLERKEGRSWLRRFGDRWGARDLVVIGVFAATRKTLHGFNRYGGRRNESCQPSA